MKEKIIIESIEEGLEKYKYYDSYKYNMDYLIDQLENIEKRFRAQEEAFNKESDKRETAIFPAYVFYKMQPSIVAPAYNLNQYLTKLNEYTVYYNFGEREKLKKTEVELNIYVNQIFISIKTLLDRCVSLFTYYIKGVSKDSTFGHIKANGTATGLINKIITIKKKPNDVDKEKEPLLDYIYEQYNEWIRIAVGPRDMIIHYNDFYTKYQHPIDGRIFPVHLEIRTFDDPYIDGEYVEPCDYNYKILYQKIHQLYEFFFTITATLSHPAYKISLSKMHYI